MYWIYDIWKIDGLLCRVHCILSLFYGLFGILWLFCWRHVELSGATSTNPNNESTIFDGSRHKKNVHIRFRRGDFHRSKLIKIIGGAKEAQYELLHQNIVLEEGVLLENE